ncbi:MAG: ABC transporter permease [Phycisphaerales bacterium]|nr:ABC transporter permease [Phycisphaerales bacterium]
MKTLVVLGIQWKLLRRDRLGLGMFILVPIAFLTMFGMAFGGLGSGMNIKIKIGILDLDQSIQSAALIKAVESGNDRMQLVPLKGDDSNAAMFIVRKGTYPGAVVIPKGFGSSLLEEGKPLALELYYDTSNPVAPELAQGKLLEAAGRGLAPALIARQLEVLEQMAGPLTERQKMLRTMLSKAAETGTQPEGSTVIPMNTSTIPIKAISSSTKQGDQSLVTYYTGAIGMMFLMFSASTICGSLLEERENGLTGRLSALGISPTQMILGRFYFSTIIGIAQFIIMLAWAAFIFKVSFTETVQLVQLACLVPLAAAAASGLGLIVTVPCSTRRQQSTLSTIIVLLLSALGGSMVPSFMLPGYLQDAGAFAFNWWAIEAFQQVLWYVSPGESIGEAIERIGHALLVLLGTSIGGLVLASAIFRSRT